MSEFAVLALLLVKHYIADFPLQFARHYLTKGTYFAWGGIEHALIHGLWTMSAFLIAGCKDPLTLATAGVVDFWFHYHIDGLKVNICKRYGWSEYHPGNLDEYGMMGHPVKPHLAIYSNHYFQAIGLDQLAHYMTYVGLVWWLV